MAYSSIAKPTDYFNTVLYTGDLQDSDGTGHTQSITGVGFQPDWVWHKGRSGARTHMIVDRVRGVSSYNWMASNSNGAELTANSNGAISSIDSDGITVQNGTDSSSKSNNAGKNGETWVFWNWLAGGSTSSNGNGSITSTVSNNSTSGFSIGTYTGNGTAGATVGHGLGATPDVLIVKERGNTNSWVFSHKDLTDQSGYYLLLNSTGAQATDNWFNNTSPTSTVFSTNSTPTNRSSGTYVFYAFKEVKGYSKFGSYTGNGNADGPFIYTGFKPAFLIIKPYSKVEEWTLLDNKRLGYNTDNNYVYPNQNYAEMTADRLDIVSNGFKLRSATGELNTSSANMIYMAFAENPFVANDSGTAVPTTAR